MRRSLVKTYRLCMGQQIGYAHPAPDRTARKAGRTWDSDDTFQVWPSRKAMAVSIRMQERGPSRPDHWHALIRLTDGEGY